MADGFLSSISGIYDSAKTAASNITGGESSSVINKAVGLIDPSSSRLSMAGLLKGGKKGKASFESSTPNIQYVGDTPDWRVRISLASQADYFYKAADKGILEPLDKTDGVIFPYTPSISVTHNAKYGSQNLTHSNYTNYFYEGSEVQAITVSGDFTVQNIDEGRYVMACIYFFRAATKMFFGQGNYAGNPPPMVFLNGYGKPYFQDVPCVITNFTHTMPADVDYINIPLKVNESRLPTNSTISVTLQPIYSRSSVTTFDLEKFARGDLLKGGFL
jgi:hypothetical protein